MDKIAFVFSGQGDQHPGMGKALVGKSAAAEEVFRMCDRLRPGTTGQCFFGTKEELMQTQNTQPCLFAMELALAEGLRERGIMPDAAAGFSLGEVAACTFAGGFDFETGFLLVIQRGLLMQEASGEKDLSMCAVLRLPAADVERICRFFPDVYPVNYNGPEQTVIAGASGPLAEASEALKEAGGRILRLPVSTAFHTPYMRPAFVKFEAALARAGCGRPSIPVYSNVTAQPYPEDFGPLLARQIMSPVRWEALVREMTASGVRTFIEIGPGKTLVNLIRRIDPSVHTCSGMDLFA